MTALVGNDPVIFEVSSKGRFMLPDGYTAILSFLDRVDGRLLMNSVESYLEEQAAPQDVPADIVAQYFVLITRMDLK